MQKNNHSPIRDNMYDLIKIHSFGYINKKMLKGNADGQIRENGRVS